IQLEQNAGIGVENPDPTVPQSELTLTGAMSDHVSYVVPLRPGQLITGNPLENPNLVPTMFGSGTVIISYDMGPLGPPPSMNELRVYYGPRGTAGSKKIADTGLVSGAATITVPYSSTAPAPTLLEIVFNEPIIRADGDWSYTATVIPDNPGGGGFTKFGS